MGPAFVEALPVGQFHGVGPATDGQDEPAWHPDRRWTCKAQTLAFLQQHFGKAGPYLLLRLRAASTTGRCARPDPQVGRSRKHVLERSVRFRRDAAELQPIIDKVWRYCERTGISRPHRDAESQVRRLPQITRSRSLATPMDSKAALEHASIELLKSLLPVSKGVRLLGITLSALGADEDHESPQLTLAL